MNVSRSRLLGLVILAGLVIFVIVEKWVIQGNIAQQHLDHIFTLPSWDEPLGTDQYGRSNSARLADAIFNSLCMAVLCVGTSSTLGIVTGVWAGWKKGWFDRFFSVWVNIVMALPGLILVLMFAAILPGSFFFYFVAISITMWADYYRVIRSRTRVIVASEAFESSRLFGFGSWYLFRRHLWPDIRADVYTLSCFGAGNAILALAALGFLYVGLRPPQAELGMMMVELFRYYHQAFWVLLQPIVAVSMMIVSFHLLSRGSEDAAHAPSE
jgi:peptide/nickel transport system permease protein